MMFRVTHLFLFVPMIFSLSVASGADEFRAGTATVEITPPLGYRMSGYFSERLSTGVKDPLLAKAVVFQQGDESAALVFCDIVAVSLDVSTQARRQAAKLTGIPFANIAIAATHSHTGPLYFGALREHFHRKAVEAHGSDPYEKVDYPSQLIKKLASVIQAARKNVQPVRLTAGYAKETRLSFNRRFHMKTGPVRFNPGPLNPNIVRVAGPIDPEVGLVQFYPVQGAKPLGAIVSFALHLDTVGGTEYSGDYPKYIQDALRKTYGDDYLSLFGAGTCGDINHVDVTIRGRRSASEIGTMLSETVSNTLKKLEAVKELSLAVRSANVNAELQTYSTEQVANARTIMERVGSRDVSFLDRVEAYKVMALQLRKEETIPLEVQAFRLGTDLAIVTLPGEVFVELGMAIKQASPFKTTLVIELTNDAPGYIPTRKAFVEGSYETVNSRVKPGNGEKMVEIAVRLLKELKK